jgi:hypothetical protein
LKILIMKKMEKVKNGDDLDSSKSPPQEKEYPS